MSKYTTRSGQNLYDIALAIYGSVEGIFDLLISNPDISFGTVFSKGIELTYHDDFILNKDVVNWLQDNNVAVKNGNYKIANTDIKEEIKAWLKKTNSQNFTLSDVTFTEVKPVSWVEDDNDGISLASEISDLPTGIITRPVISSPIQNWGDQIFIGTTKDNLIGGSKDKLILSIGKLDEASQNRLLNKWYIQGMINLPTDEEELEAYYNNVATPKIKIVQTGSTSAFNVQIPANRFIAVDWGDDSGIEFFHYQRSTTRVTHTYEDDETHDIYIYGHNEFTNLDFTEINGIYYALASIYISKQFITPYANMEILNKLFIIQANE